MLTQNGMNNSALWEVRWISKKKIVRKVYGSDFPAALERYHTLRTQGHKLVALRCMNIGFRPPDSLIADEVEDSVIVTRNRKRYKKKVVDIVDHMPDLNLEGKYWCPYCIKLLPWRQVEAYGELLMVCPLCDISTRDFHVKRWNPGAKTIEYKGRKVRRRVGNRAGKSKADSRARRTARRAR